jgi:vancomycin resistance protein YoaR
MRKVLLGILVLLAAAGTTVTVTAARYQPVVRPNTFVGPVAVGGLTPTDAAHRLRLWWEMERVRPLEIVCERVSGTLPTMTASELGVRLDDQASIANLPLQDFLGSAAGKLGQAELPRAEFEPVFVSVEVDLTPLAEKVNPKLPKPRPARARWSNGAVARTPETSGLELDVASIGPAAIAAVRSGEPVSLRVMEAPKRVPDAELAKVNDVVGTFTTSFNARQANRSSNIKLAASKFDGMVLMPGERISFNGVVGRRTAKAGYREAGIYLNGRTDTGIGGGICQVSTTLYNAALLANLKIVSRTNHSMPVPYVPIGRDAAVDYGSIDLVLENPGPAPVAVESGYASGQVTFRILGRKEPGTEVQILRLGAKSWSTGEKVVPDPSLAAGVRKVVEKGSAGHSIDTVRVVKKNGTVVKREPLGKSHYRGGQRIVHVGVRPPAPAASPKRPPTVAPPAAPPEDEAFG